VDQKGVGAEENPAPFQRCEIETVTTRHTADFQVVSLIAQNWITHQDQKGAGAKQNPAAFQLCAFEIRSDKFRNQKSENL
jgi:hypothetical protein